VAATRTEILSPDVRWWEFNDDVKHSIMAAGFGVLNLAYVGQHCWRLLPSPRGGRWSSTLRTTVARIADRLRAAALGISSNAGESGAALHARMLSRGDRLRAAYLAQATKRERHAGSHFSNPDSCS